MKVLIAEDNELSRRKLEKLLNKWDYEVISVIDGNQAWDTLQGKEPPDIAIMDWLMPGMDGVEVCRCVDQSQRYIKTYIILLSANDSREDIVFALNAGADDYITKPFEYKELLARIRVGQRIVELQNTLDDRIKELEKTKESLEQANEALRDEIAMGRQREEALQENEKKTRTILESIEEGYYEVDLKGNFMLVNNSMSNMLGYSIGELIGMNNRHYMDKENAERAYRAFNRVFTTGRSIKGFEYEIVQKDGTKRQRETSISLIRDSKDNKTGFRGITRDVTERKLLEFQLQQAQKLESVGQLAAGIAHEINTPIQFVGDNIKFLGTTFEELRDLQEKQGLFLEAVKSGEANGEMIEKIEEALEKADIEYLKEEMPKAIMESLEGVDRVSKIVKAMKDFSHPGVIDITSSDINKAIETTVTVARNEWKYVAELKTDLDPSLPPVPCMVSEINQVLLNLIINAAQAIGDVVGKKGEEGKGLITINTGQINGYVEIRVTDTGTGISKNIRQRIFEPFFTTKEVGKGSGQGLAMAHNVIVKKHHGELTFETVEGKGTSFIIRLPLTGDVNN